ncbi:MAG TPA: class I SAM-dependent methyltransferase [Vicinamibacteria bacterium]|nr:class I SAM-dependent methyltransferase [Vicinamibacteria bacterium]
MTAGPPDPTSRFSDRVQDYVRWRPGYPRQVVDALRTDLGLQPSHVVADVGSGTGILSRLLVENGNVVFGVEPNREMAAVAEADLVGSGRFHSVDGRAEATTLGDASVDLVTAGQAFHWFKVPESRAEFRRILRPRGGVALVWNLRRLDSTPFLRDYEAFLRRWSNDYEEVSEKYAKEASLRELFGEGGWRERRFDSAQHFDLEGLRGRLLSSSYTPKEGDPRRAAMLAALPSVFEAHAREGRVAFEYDTRLFLGRLA